MPGKSALIRPCGATFPEGEGLGAHTQFALVDFFLVSL